MNYLKYIGLTFYTCFILFVTWCLTPLAYLYGYLCDAGIETEIERAKVMKKLNLVLSKTQKKLLDKESG